MRVVADVERCRAVHPDRPEVFDQDEKDGTVVVLVDEPPPELHHAIAMAALLCPTSVIRVEET
jgi:ferredoxin